MKYLQSLFGWWSTNFKKQKPMGKLVFGCLSLFVFLCLCSVPVAILTPNSGQNTSVEDVKQPEMPTFALNELPTETPSLLIEVSPEAIITMTSTQTPELTATLVETQQQANVSGPNCIPVSQPQTGKVVEVVDGDTIRVLIDGLVYSVRYIGIDTPENTTQTEFFGKEATAKNSELVYGKEITLYKDKSETDPYNRLLRYVFVDDFFVNYELVAQGFATAVDYPPDVSCSALFHDAENSAKSQLLGLWVSVSAQATQSAGTVSLVIIYVDKQAEFVEIKNNSNEAISLNGWVLLSERGSQSCGLAGEIQPNEILRIWAQSGSTGYSCGNSSPIWNNNEPDPAILYNPQGQEVSRYP